MSEVFHVSRWLVRTWSRNVAWVDYSQLSSCYVLRLSDLSLRTAVRLYEAFGVRVAADQVSAIFECVRTVHTGRFLCRVSTSIRDLPSTRLVADD